MVDGGDFLEVQAGFATNIVIGFGRVTGARWGSSPTSRWCRPARWTSTPPTRPRASSASATPSTFRWSPSSTCRASCPAWQQEYGGIIRHGAKMLFAYSVATVPKITVAAAQGLRRRLPGHVRQGPGRRPVFAWPDRRDRRHGRRRAPPRSCSARRSTRPPNKAEKRRELIEQYRETFSNPYVAAARGLVDAVIEPALTRRHIAQALEYLRVKREPRPHKKHGLMPLYRPAEVTEEDMVFIAAAVAAYLGVRARIRQVRLVQSVAWAQVGRATIHASHRV
jgi:methylmalonyl-CoA carboxyltransferase large subunit